MQALSFIFGESHWLSLQAEEMHVPTSVVAG
jgi:hypothetical protein